MVTDCHEVPDAAAGRRCVPLPPPPPRRSIKPTTTAAAVCKLRARQRFVPSKGNIEEVWVDRAGSDITEKNQLS